jgi:hypothetical protein
MDYGVSLCRTGHPVLKKCAMMIGMSVRGYVASVLLAAIATCAASVAAADAPHDSTAPAKAASDTAAPPAAVSAPVPGNQIWECTTNGLRTFSNNPCGTKSSIRQLNPINVMEPAPVYRVTHAYAPAAAPPAPSSMNYSYPSQDSGDDTYPDAANSAYPGYIVVARTHRVRPHVAAPHHPHPHHP